MSTPSVVDSWVVENFVIAVEAGLTDMSREASAIIAGAEHF